MPKAKKKSNITELIQDLKTQTEKYGHFERSTDSDPHKGTRESHYYEVDASTVTNLLGALDELRSIVGKG